MKSKVILLASLAALIGATSVKAQLNVGGTTAPITTLDVQGSAYIKTNLGVNTSTPARKLEVNAASAPIRLSNLSAVASTTNVLAIDASGDVTSVPVNNLSTGNTVVTNYASYRNIYNTVAGTVWAATGNEGLIIYSNNGTVGYITLPALTSSQYGKTITIAHIGNAGTLSFQPPSPYTPIYYSGGSSGRPGVTGLSSAGVPKLYTLAGGTGATVTLMWTQANGTLYVPTDGWLVIQ